MSEPRRLLTGGSSDFERALLRAWDQKQPSNEARAKTLAMVGLGVSVGMAGTVAGAGGSVAPKALVAGSALLKWLAVGGFGVVTVAGAIGYAEHRASRPLPELVAVASVAPPAPHPVEAAPVQIEARAALPSVAERAPAAGTKPTVGAASKSTLDEEVTSIDEARRVLGAGDDASALQLVDAYDAKFPAGLLAQESKEIRIEALVRQGNRAAAERLASRFLASHPTSPYAHKIRALLASPTDR